LAAVPDAHVGVVWAAVLGSGPLVIIALVRSGIRLFWHVPGDDAPLVPDPGVPARPVETAATTLLVACPVAMSLSAAPLLRQGDATAAQRLSPQHYLLAVRGTVPQARSP